MEVKVNSKNDTCSHYILLYIVCLSQKNNTMVWEGFCESRGSGKPISHLQTLNRVNEY